MQFPSQALAVDEIDELSVEVSPMIALVQQVLCLLTLRRIADMAKTVTMQVEKQQIIVHLAVDITILS